jgi:cytochrome b6-f complex iron-sulfur subunit
MPGFSRRSFLKITTQGLLTISGLLGLGGLVRFLSYEPDPPPPTRYEVGDAKNFPMNSHTVLPNIPAILIHEPGGFSAMSLVCTHLGCTVEVKTNELACPCHGSRYGMDGKVTKGPAVEPLPQLRVELTKDGKVVVYQG